MKREGLPIATAARRRLDVHGLLCPVPLLMTARAIDQLAVGARLEVVGDDPEMADDIPAWCLESGHRLLALERDGRSIRCLVEKREPSDPDPR